MAKWFGINYPFNKGIQNVFSRREDIPLIKNDIIQLFYTSPGERAYRPEYGIGARNYVFDLNDDNSLIRERIVSQLSVYEPRVNIEELDVSSEDHTMSIHLVLSLVQFPDETFTLDLYFDNLE